ncbi:restriction endonuclease subunit S [Leptolyngbya sp. BC1307]|uniref:restriction endonuclease subunit S n=1 Tax=Leptolyngbya sp. BC1307 TaxID=2029589 RepID=UPI000EFCEC0F|nr:restriction endonuclease subunit S [Leptolyngbya sp. BC1307]
MRKPERDIPNVRFVEFTEDWKKLKVEQISECVTSGSRGWAEYYSTQGAKFIRMTNLDRNNIQLQLSDLKYVLLPSHSSEGKRTALKTGDILISITAELGKIGIVPNNLGEAYINQHVCLVRPNPAYVFPHFLAFGLSTFESHKRLNRLNDSGAKAGLNLGSIKKFSIKTPTISEQKKISGFLEAIATHLTQLRRKHELLQTYKRGVMQKIFSQQIRFKQADGTPFPEWNGKRLKMLGDLKNGFNADKQAFGEGTQFINLMDIFGQNEITKTTLGRVKISSKQIEQYKIQKGDVLFVRSSVKREGVGQSCLVNDDFSDTVYSGFIIRFREHSTELNHLYKKYCFSSAQFRKKLLSLATSSANTNINQESLSNIQLSYPHPKEQEKITNLLSAIDEKIRLISFRIECGEKFKQGLLQKMFV